MSEGIEWHQSKRRLKKLLTNRKKLGVRVNLLKKFGIKGYDIVKDGYFEYPNYLFNHGTGIIFIGLFSGEGHAIFWDGCKFIDSNKNSRFDGSTDLSELRGDEFVFLSVVKKNRNPITVIKSHLSLSLIKLTRLWAYIRN
jgi:hypothetical protein